MFSCAYKSHEVVLEGGALCSREHYRVTGGKRLVHFLLPQGHYYTIAGTNFSKLVTHCVLAGTDFGGICEFIVQINKV